MRENASSGDKRRFADTVRPFWMSCKGSVVSSQRKDLWHRMFPAITSFWLEASEGLEIPNSGLWTDFLEEAPGKFLVLDSHYRSFLLPPSISRGLLKVSIYQKSLLGSSKGFSGRRG